MKTVAILSLIVLSSSAFAKCEIDLRHKKNREVINEFISETCEEAKSKCEKQHKNSEDECVKPYKTKHSEPELGPAEFA